MEVQGNYLNDNESLLGIKSLYDWIYSNVIFQNKDVFTNFSSYTFDSFLLMYSNVVSRYNLYFK